MCLNKVNRLFAGVCVVWSYIDGEALMTVAGECCGIIIPRKRLRERNDVTRRECRCALERLPTGRRSHALFLWGGEVRSVYRRC